MNNYANNGNHGKHARGERAPSAKLTAAKVVEIRRRAKAGESILVIADDYGISKQAVSQAVLRITWAHVE